MTDNSDIAPRIGGLDPLAEKDSVTSSDAVHIRIQKRNGRKCLTTVQGLPAKFDKKKIVKALKKDFCCNGTVVEDAEWGTVIQLQGDHRKNVSQFLLEAKLVKKDNIKLHGF